MDENQPPIALDGSFGARNVGETERRALIRQVFVEVAPRYDLMNDLMSFGIHRVWKRRFARLVAPRAHERIVDLGGGTGDIARQLMACGALVVVADPSLPMLLAGRRSGESLHHVACEGEALPFADASLDCLTISFGIRNVTRMDVTLGEIHRVLRPGGRFFCLEFSTPHPLLRPFYALWSATIIPVLGAGVSNSRAAYRYLVESIRRFPDQEEFAGLIEQAGFRAVTYENLSFGIAAIHYAIKPAEH